MEGIDSSDISIIYSTVDPCTDAVFNTSNLTGCSSVGQTTDTAPILSDGYSVPHIVLTTILVAVIMFVIVFGNLLVVIAIFTDKNLKTTQNWFIANLAVADFLLGLVIMPFSWTYEMMGYWYFGHIVCDLWKAIDVLLSTASILSICLISLDRYWSITRAIEYSRSRTPTRAALMIAAVWFLSAVICLPPLIGWKNPLPVTEYPQCLLSSDIGYVLYSTMGSFYIPCVIMVFVYFQIFRAARRLARKNIKKKEQFRKEIKDELHTDYNDMPTDSNSNSGNDKNASHEERSCTMENDHMEECKNAIQGNENSLVTSGGVYLSSHPEHVHIQQSNKKDIDVSIKTVYSQNGNKSYTLVCTDTDSTETPTIQVDDASLTGATVVADSSAENRSDTNLYPKMTCIRKLSDTLSKKRSRRTSNKATKGWRTSSLKEHERHKRKLAKARERRATIVLGLVMIAFILCWFPFFTLYIITSFCNCIGSVVFAIVFWAGYCNSALNPIIYTVFNRDFRHAFHRIICKKMKMCR